MKYAIISLLCCGLVTGCATPTSDKIIKLTAPDVVVYDKATQAQAAQEMDKYCGYTPIICNMIVDYGVMRDQSRIIKGEKVDINR